jgi:hypothetical protein
MHAPMPALDLSDVDRPCRPLPWRVAQVLADGLDPADASACAATRAYRSPTTTRRRGRA